MQGEHVDEAMGLDDRAVRYTIAFRRFVNRA
jgi:hypothetical protein